MSRKKTQKDEALTALEMCAGAGGLSLGVHRAGFRHLALIENDNHAAETLRRNCPSLLDINPDIVIEEDAAKVDFRPFVGEVDLLSGGPPCPPFSIGGKGVGYDDPRNVFPAIFDALALLMSKAVFIENVKGLLRPRFKEAFEYIKKRIQFPHCRIRKGEQWHDHYARLLKVKDADFLDDEQYVVGAQLIDTADYGAPQRRERVFITAFRRDLGLDYIQLEPTHSRQALLVDQWITREYWERHKISGKPPRDHLGKTDLRILEGIEKNPALAETRRAPWVTVREALHGLPEPVPRGVEPTFPNHIQHPGARTYPNHSGSFLDYPAKALKAGVNGTPGGENILRVSSNGKVRYFTTREAARLQTFPDEWVFHGYWGACIKQLGNAVPVSVVELFAKETYRRLREAR
jgi:DNA (cytosine-5)-methyltransferase 1